jgi:hypothetical protein
MLTWAVFTLSVYAMCMFSHDLVRLEAAVIDTGRLNVGTSPIHGRYVHEDVNTNSANLSTVNSELAEISSSARFPRRGATDCGQAGTAEATVVDAVESEEDLKYSRQLLIFGAEAQRTLKRSSVVFSFDTNSCFREIQLLTEIVKNLALMGVRSLYFNVPSALTMSPFDMHTFAELFEFVRTMNPDTEVRLLCATSFLPYS